MARSLSDHTVRVVLTWILVGPVLVARRTAGRSRAPAPSLPASGADSAEVRPDSARFHVMWTRPSRWSWARRSRAAPGERALRSRAASGGRAHGRPAAPSVEHPGREPHRPLDGTDPLRSPGSCRLDVDSRRARRDGLRRSANEQRIIGYPLKFSGRRLDRELPWARREIGWTRVRCAGRHQEPIGESAVAVEEDDIERHEDLIHAHAGGRWGRGVKDKQCGIETAQRRHSTKALSECHAHDAKVPIADRYGLDR